MHNIKYPIFLLIVAFLNACTLQQDQALTVTKDAKLAAITSFSEHKQALPKKEATPKSQAQVQAQAFDLNQSIQSALSADPVIAAAFEGINQAEADAITAGLLPNPDFSAGGSLIPLDKRFTVNRQGGPPQADVGLAMPIDWFLFGKRAAAVVSARIGVDIASADFANTVRLRIAGTIAAFYTVLEAQAMLELAQENQDNLTKTEQIISNRVELGGVGTIEADRIRLSIFSSHRDVHARELELAAALNQFRALLGIADDVPINVKGTLEVENPLKPITIETAFQSAEENRPDLVSMQRQLDKANADIALQESKAYPQVTPKIGLTRQFQQQAIGYPDANSWGAGVDVTIPIFDRNQGNIAKARSIFTQSQLNLQSQWVNMRSEIDQAVKTFSSAYRILVDDDPGQLDAAKSVRDKINQAYALGGKTLIEVLDAQRIYLETYRMHISSRANYWHALYQLNAVIGKDVFH